VLFQKSSLQLSDVPHIFPVFTAVIIRRKIKRALAQSIQDTFNNTRKTEKLKSLLGTVWNRRLKTGFKNISLSGKQNISLSKNRV